MQYELRLYSEFTLNPEPLPGPEQNSAELLSSIAGRRQAAEIFSRYATLTDLARASVDELREIPGVGASKAAAIKAAFLLAEKLSHEKLQEAPLLDTPERVAELLKEQNRLHTVEVFQVALLNTRRRLLSMHA